MKINIVMLIIILIVLILDIGSKFLIDKYMSVGEVIPVIKNFFDLTYVKNTGVAWSMFENNVLLVNIVSCVIILMLIFYTYKNGPKDWLDKIGRSCIIGGALGNFFDRVLHGSVVDFLDFKIFGYDYPIFNLADTFIVIGAILLVIHAWRDNKNGDKGSNK